MAKNSLIFLLLAWMLTACGPKAVYEEYVDIPKKGWYKDSAVSFEVDVKDTSAAYEIVWYLRNNDQYEYSNIYLFRNVRSKRGTEFADTAQFLLADPYGKWLGKGVGELKTNTWPFKTGYLRFRHGGKYIFTLQQAMRTDYLKGVENVGLGIFKLEPGEQKDGKKES